VATFWAFVLTCALSWIAAPAALGPLRVDLFTGLTGTLAWGLYAFTWAAPATDPVQAPDDDEEDEPLVPRRRLAGREAYVVAMGGVAAVAIQAVGWYAPGVERSLLVRAFGLAAGLAVIDGSVEVARTRYARNAPAAVGVRLRAARTWLILLGALVVAASFFALRG
jgi:hypothetical protein